MRGRITKRAVDSLSAPVSGETTLWDDALASFGVRVRPGGAKTYLLMYRAGAGRSSPLRKMTIGKQGSPWTPDTARTEAKRLLGLVAGGADPAAVKSKQREAETIADLAARFLAEHLKTKRKERTVAEYQRLLDRLILPAIGKKKVGDVTRADIARLHHAHCDTPYQANRVLAVLSKMFNLAEVWGIRPDGSNPCRHVERNPERGRERMLSAAELARLGDALVVYEGSSYVPAAIKLLLFTGARCPKSSDCSGITLTLSLARRACQNPKQAQRRFICHRQPWRCWQRSTGWKEIPTSSSAKSLERRW